jgi:hypothetical protein
LILRYELGFLMEVCKVPLHSGRSVNVNAPQKCCNCDCTSSVYSQKVVVIVHVYL